MIKYFVLKFMGQFESKAGVVHRVTDYDSGGMRLNPYMATESHREVAVVKPLQCLTYLEVAIRLTISCR